MKIQTTPTVNWNSTPFNVENKISKEVRSGLSKRFDAAIIAFRGILRYNDLKLEDGWIVKSKTDVVFVLQSDNNEDLPANVDLGREELNTSRPNAKLRKLADDVWDSETYAELNKVEGIFTDPTTGKITIKVV